MILASNCDCLIMFNLDCSDEAYLKEEVYDIIRTIRDPEFPKTLEELDVVDPNDVHLWVEPRRVVC